MLFKVDMEPFAVRGAGASRRGRHEFGPHTGLAHVLGGDHRVENEGMDATVPGDVDKPDEPVVFPSAGLAEAVTVHSCPPIGVPLNVTERIRVERVDGGTAEVTAPLIRDRHGPHRRP